MRAKCKNKEEAVVINMKFKKVLERYPTFASIFAGIAAAILISLFIGIPTDIIANSKYMRMTPATDLDTFFLISASLLFGTYIGLSSYVRIAKKRKIVSRKSGIVGAFGSFFAVACPICIIFLVWIFGASFLMKYYDPLRPVIGFFSIGLIGFAVFNNLKLIRNKHECKTCIN